MRHTLFEKFGHRCGLQHIGREGRSHQGKFSFKRWKTIRETSKRGYTFLRSQKKIHNEQKKQELYPYIIHPFSDLRTAWEMLMCVILAVQFYTIAMDVAFQNLKKSTFQARNFWFLGIRLFSDAISMIDVVVNFFTGYCDHKNSIVVLEPRKIAWRYIMPYFFFDVYCSIPIDMITYFTVENIDTRISQAVIYLVIGKLFRYPVFIKYFLNFSEQIGISYWTLRLLIVAISLLAYIHIICCLSIAWIAWDSAYIPQYADYEQFVMSYGPGAGSLRIIYLRFFYCSCLMVFNSAFAFYPTANASFVFLINACVVSRLLNVFIIAYFMEVHSSTGSSHQKYIDILNDVQDYLQHQHIPKFLQERILTYYDVKYQKCYFRESEILNTVSGQLRQEIVMNTCRKLVENVTFFKNIPLALLVRIVSCLKYEIYLTNDVITKEGSPGDSMFFISNGTVAIYSRTGKEICHLQDGNHFGEIALVMKDSLRIATVVATEVCELYRLEKKDFIRAIMPYPDLFEKVLFIAAERLEKTDVLDENDKFARHKFSSFNKRNY